jgi:type IV secretory pathway TraG/TraD family ATPase VirD4
VISGIWGEADETRSGIYASAQTLFAPWEDTRIATNSELTETVDLDWLYGGAGRRSLYICMPEHPKDALRFAVVFGGLIGALTDQAYAKRNRTNQQLPNLLLVLDEAGNTAASWLPDLSTTCASVGITLMSFWQSLAQIQHRYGDRTNTLITNHLTKIFFGGISDPMSGDTASKLSGSQEVLSRSSTTSDNSNNGARRSLTENTTATGLIGADLVRQIRPGDALCIHGTLQPIHLRTRRYWEDRALRRRAEGVLGRRLTEELERARVNASPASAPVAIGTAATTLPAASLPSQDSERTANHDDQAESEDNHDTDELVSAHNNEPQDADENPQDESN